MNRYGTMAMRHWEQFDPDRFQAIPESDREAFFTELGERVESEILALTDAIAGADRPGETYLQKVARLNQARFDAESDILREMVLIPEPEENDEGDQPPTGPLADMYRAIQRRMDEENEL